jgi:hypothetical protein
MLSKWNVGSNRISGSIRSGSVLVKFIGIVSEVNEVGFKIVQESGVDVSLEWLGEIQIGLNTAEVYELEVRDIRQEPRSTVSMLQIHLAGFITCVLFEYTPDASKPTYLM